MPKWGSHGSVRGVLRKERPYRENCTMDWRSTAPAVRIFLANQLRVLLTAAAYVLMQELRLSARGGECARVQVSTLRERLLKLGVWVERSVRRIVLHLPVSFAYRSDWLRIARSVGAVPA